MTLVLYICEIREVHQNLEKEKNPSGFFDIRVVHQNLEKEKNPSGFFDFFSTLILWKTRVEETRGNSSPPEYFWRNAKSKNPAGSSPASGLMTLSTKHKC